MDDGGLLGGEQLQQKQLQQVLKVRAEQQLARKNNPAAARRKVKAMQGRVLETTTAPLDPLPRC